MNFTKWLDTLLEEKGLDSYKLYEIEGPSGINFMERAAVVEAIKNASLHEQKGIKTMIVKIDFMNKSVDNYLQHLAKALVR